MGYGDKLDDIIEAAVARGDAPGVVAAVVLGLAEDGLLGLDVLRAAARPS